MIRFFATVALLASALLSSTADASYYQSWRGWSFEYDVYSQSGLELRNVSRNTTQVARRISLPTVRVDYSPGSCNESPFSDLITKANLLPKVVDPIANLPTKTSWCGKQFCIREYAAQGHDWLEIGVTAHEGNYLLYQAYYLNEAGHLIARIYSSGEQCPNATHRHHAYWRFDLDVNTYEPNSVYQYDDDLFGGVPPDVGFGPGVTRFDTERAAIKDRLRNRMWFVENDRSKNRVWIVPGRVNGRDDGVADAFAPFDLMALKYQTLEDEGPWTDHFGGEFDITPYNNGEAIAGANPVLWYVAHFQHDEPLHTHSTAASCGDRDLAPIYSDPRIDCNDVFGAGPSLVTVLSPSDRSPVPPFDFSPRIHVVRDQCGIGASAGGQQRFVVLTGPLPAGVTPRFRWSTRGGVVVGADDRDSALVRVGNSPVEVTVEVKVYDNTRVATVWFTPETATSLRMKRLACGARLGDGANMTLIDPLFDPTRDLTARPWTRDEIERVYDLGRRLQLEAGALRETVRF